MIQDPVIAIMDILKADPDIANLVGDRVHGAELPKAETDNMPRKNIVVRQSGGGSFPVGERDYIEHAANRIDILNYGETPVEAAKLRRASYPVLKQLERTVINNTLVHWANPSGGPIQLRDIQTEWPLMFDTFEVFFAERQAV